MLDTKYDHKKVEEGKYNYWLKKGYFECYYSRYTFKI